MKKPKRRTSRSAKVIKSLKAEIEKMKEDRAELFSAIFKLAAMFTGVVEASDDLRDMLTSLPGYNGGLPQTSRCKPVDIEHINRSGVL